MRNNVIMLATIAAVVLVLAACDKVAPEPVVHIQEVYVPVYEKGTPPQQIYRVPLSIVDMPVFLPPGSPAASSCLATEGEARLRGIMVDREKRLDGWEKWTQ